MDEKDMKNPHDTKRVPIVRDGAGYTPSGADDFDYDFDYDPDASAYTNPPSDEDEDIAKTRKIATAPPRDNIMPKRQPQSRPVVKKQSRKQPPKKSHYAVFLVTTVFVSVIAVVFVFAMLFNQWSLDGFNSGREPNQNAQAGTSPQPEREEQTEQEELVVEPGNLSLIGLVQEINLPSGRMDLYVLDNSELRSFFVENHSILRDRFGNSITFSAFTPGDVVEIVHMEASTVIETARISAQAWPYRNIRDVVVNTETNEILIGNNRYTFSPYTVVSYKGEPMNITDVSEVDIVTVHIFDDKVVFVDIHQGSGIIRIPENDMIIQGTVEVANTTFTALAGEMEIRVPEGGHRVVIRGDNIEIFEYELTVERGGSASVNFDGLVLLAGSLTVNVDDPYVTLTIDGEIQLTNSMIVLDYGTYMVSVTREGFVPFEREVTIGSADGANHEITVVLEEIIRARNVTLTTSPTGARIYLDGQYVGLSPVSLELELGRYTVAYALEGFIGGASDIWISSEEEQPMQPLFSWWLQSDPNFISSTPTPQPTPAPALYPEVSPSPSPSPFFNNN